MQQCCMTIDFQLATFPLFIVHRPLEYERVHLSFCKVTYTPFHIQGFDILS